MAETKSALIASVQKHAGRAKEKLLQNLGKVDRTADEIFDEHLGNFNRQQSSANKLQKEFNNYIRCIRAVQSAHKSLMDAICEIYEPQWSGYDVLLAQAQSSESLWQDFSHKLGDQVLIPLNTYTAQFPETKKKIEKRNRKLIDYDSQRHSFQNLQANASKRKDDVKLTKGREQLEEARRTYELLNTELHDELPALHDSRILFLVTNLQTLFASEQVFHSETSKIYAELEAIIDKLATDSQRGSYHLKKPTGNVIKMESTTKGNLAMNNSYANQITNGSNNANSPVSNSSTPSLQPEEQSPKLDITPISSPSLEQKHMDKSSLSPEEESVKEDNEPSYQNALAVTEANITSNNEESEDLNKSNANEIEPATKSTITESENQQILQPPNKPEYVNGNVESPASSTPEKEVAGARGNPLLKKTDVVGNNNKMEELYDIPIGATTTGLPPGVLYRVKATYGYVKEDGDELSFEIGEIINVIEYDDPEDQEEGWLMGQKEGTDEKGLFPANFTRPI